MEVDDIGGVTGGDAKKGGGEGGQYLFHWKSFYGLEVIKRYTPNIKVSEAPDIELKNPTVHNGTGSLQNVWKSGSQDPAFRHLLHHFVQRFSSIVPFFPIFNL